MAPTVTIDPDIEKRPILQPETYGGDGSATLEVFDFRPARWDNTMTVAHFEVVIRHPELGFVRVFQDKDQRQGSVLPRWLRQLGVSDEEMRNGFDTEKLQGLKVVADIGVREYTNRDDERVQQNTVKNLHRLA